MLVTEKERHAGKWGLFQKNHNSSEGLGLGVGWQERGTRNDF
jgi:hypothetical protein